MAQVIRPRVPLCAVFLTAVLLTITPSQGHTDE